MGQSFLFQGIRHFSSTPIAAMSKRLKGNKKNNGKHFVVGIGSFDARHIDAQPTVAAKPFRDNRSDDGIGSSYSKRKERRQSLGPFNVSKICLSVAP